mmetsp:Transcript_3098/g.8779  ORF Transcript_3098/g.8779 Transcript_3098/m.8779 type:complete len:91 (+) Transcript_3098:2-274(+)
MKTTPSDPTTQRRRLIDKELRRMGVKNVKNMKLIDMGDPPNRVVAGYSKTSGKGDKPPSLALRLSKGFTLLALYRLVTIQEQENEKLRRK